MTISTKSISPTISLINISGRLDQSQLPSLDSAIEKSLKKESVEIIVDLSQTTYINSGGLRCLVSGWRKAKQLNSNLYLCGLNNRLQEIFEMVGFDQVFSIYENKESALQDQQSKE